MMTDPNIAVWELKKQSLMKVAVQLYIITFVYLYDVEVKYSTYKNMSELGN